KSPHILRRDMDTSPDDSHASQSTGPHRGPATRRGGGYRRKQKASADMQPHRTPHRFWEFAALAHEVRQPLTAILSNAQAAWHVLAMDTPDLAEVRAALADII